jgi:hypothetical protein
LARVNVLPAAIGSFLDFSRGASEFGVNAWILVLALGYLRSDRPAVPAV